jgi:hypothetical protein
VRKFSRLQRILDDCCNRHDPTGRLGRSVGRVKRTTFPADIPGTDLPDRRRRESCDVGFGIQRFVFNCSVLQRLNRT